MSRVEVTNILKEICVNVTQSYPDFLEVYPLLIYKLEQTGKASFDTIEYYNQSLTVEIYTETSEERSILEKQLIEKLYFNGWINNSNIDASNVDHYRNILKFERNN